MLMHLLLQVDIHNIFEKKLNILYIIFNITGKSKEYQQLQEDEEPREELDHHFVTLPLGIIDMYLPSHIL